jgi:hypothetical protein
MQDLKHKILLILLSLTIISEVASIILWTVNPSLPSGEMARFSLATDYKIAVLNAVVMVALNLMAMFWIIKRKKRGPLFLIVISIGNRIASQPIFDGGMHLIFVTWTALLVIFAYLEYLHLNRIETLLLVGGVIFALIVSILIFTFTGNQTFGFIVYVLVLAFLVGTLTTIKKFR